MYVPVIITIMPLCHNHQKKNAIVFWGVYVDLLLLNHLLTDVHCDFTVVSRRWKTCVNYYCIQNSGKRQTLWLGSTGFVGRKSKRFEWSIICGCSCSFVRGCTTVPGSHSGNYETWSQKQVICCLSNQVSHLIVFSGH